MRTIPALCVLLLGLTVSSCVPVSAPITADERAVLLSKADIVFEGKPVSVKAVTGNDTADAMEGNGDIGYIATFNVEKIVKGTYKKSTFVIAVHSPATSFRLYPWEAAMAKNRTYRVYIDYTSRDKTLIYYENITVSK